MNGFTRNLNNFTRFDRIFYEFCRIIFYTNKSENTCISQVFRLIVLHSWQWEWIAGTNLSLYPSPTCYANCLLLYSDIIGKTTFFKYNWLLNYQKIEWKSDKIQSSTRENQANAQLQRGSITENFSGRLEQGGSTKRITALNHPKDPLPLLREILGQSNSTNVHFI